jgi:outer membrane protein assembly factor BamA
VRGVGPGQFPGLADKAVSYLLQNGDIKLVMNLEYRRQLFGKLHGALFLDAGNIWNFDEDYDDPEAREVFANTKFRLSHFLNDLALGTGIGIRYDLNFLILRLDWGIALHMPYDTGKSGYFNINRFKDCHTLHFAIGYPF